MNESTTSDSEKNRKRGVGEILGAIDRLTKRLDDLENPEKHWFWNQAKEYKAHLDHLQSSVKDFQSDLGKEAAQHRDEIRASANEYKEAFLKLLETSKTQAVWLLGTGVLSLAGLVTFFMSQTKDFRDSANQRVADLTQHVNYRVEQAEHRATNQLGDLETRIRRVVDQTLESSNLIEEVERKVEDRFVQQTTERLIETLYQDLARLKMDLQRKIDFPSDRPSGLGLDDIRDLIMDVEGLQTQYGGAASQRQLSRERRESLYCIINGFVEKSAGRMDNAEKWFRRAIFRDRQFIEPQVFLARHLLEKNRYAGGGSFTNSLRYEKEALETLSEAARFSQATNNPTFQNTIDLLFYKKDQLRDAIDHAKTRNKESAYSDARLAYRLGVYHWLLFTDSKDEMHRSEAANYYKEAVERAPDYVKAINNFIWLMCHANDDEIQLAPESENTVRRLLSKAKPFEQAMNADALINVIEGYWAIGERARARAMIARVDELLPHPDVHNATVDWVRERIERIRKIAD